MSPLFGRKTEEPPEQRPADQWEQTLRAELDRLNALPLEQLAADVMTTEFGRADADPDAITVAGGNIHAGPHVYAISTRLMATRGIDFPVGPMKDRELQEAIVRLVAEALQRLEHAALVRVQVHNPAQSGPDYAITRHGRAALERDDIESVLSVLGG